MSYSHHVTQKVDTYGAFEYEFAYENWLGFLVREQVVTASIGTQYFLSLLPPKKQLKV